MLCLIGGYVESKAEDFALFHQHSRWMLERYIFLRVSDRELAEDLASEAFAIAWERMNLGETITVRWLLTTARNLIGNEYQRRKRERVRVQRAAMEDAARVETWGVQIDHIGLRMAMAQLRAEDALVLQLVYWHGLSASEAAVFFECSVGALWVRLTRARSTLRALVDDGVRLSTRAEKRGDSRG